MDKFEYAKGRLAEWGLTEAVPVVRGATSPEIVAGFGERTSWLRDRFPGVELGNHPSRSPWHIWGANDHLVYGFRDPDVAFEFKLRFGS